MKTIKIGLAVLVLAMIVVATILRIDNSSGDPFVNMYTMTWQQDWTKAKVAGDVSDYQTPISVRDMPDVDWGARSIHFSTALPLEGELHGTFDENRLTLYCYQQSVAAIAANIARIPKSNMPPEILTAAQRKVANTDGTIYIRQCYGTVRPRDPMIPDQNASLQGSGSSSLFDRCVNEIQKRFHRVVETTYDPDEGVFSVLHVSFVDGSYGKVLGASCRQPTHPSGLVHFFTWYLPELQ